MKRELLATTALKGSSRRSAKKLTTIAATMLLLGGQAVAQDFNQDLNLGVSFRGNFVIGTQLGWQSNQDWGFKGVYSYFNDTHYATGDVIYMPKIAKDLYLQLGLGAGIDVKQETWQVKAVSAGGLQSAAAVGNVKPTPATKTATYNIRPEDFNGIFMNVLAPQDPLVTAYNFVFAPGQYTVVVNPGKNATTKSVTLNIDPIWVGITTGNGGTVALTGLIYLKDSQSFGKQTVLINQCGFADTACVSATGVTPPAIVPPSVTTPPVVITPPVTSPPVVVAPPVTTPPVVVAPPVTTPPVVVAPPVTTPPVVETPPVSFPPVLLTPSAISNTPTVDNVPAVVAPPLVSLPVDAAQPGVTVTPVINMPVVGNALSGDTTITKTNVRFTFSPSVNLQWEPLKGFAVSSGVRSYIGTNTEFVYTVGVGYKLAF